MPLKSERYGKILHKRSHGHHDGIEHVENHHMANKKWRSTQFRRNKTQKAAAKEPQPNNKIKPARFNQTRLAPADCMHTITLHTHAMICAYRYLYINMFNCRQKNKRNRTSFRKWKTAQITFPTSFSQFGNCMVYCLKKTPWHW